MSHQHTPLHSLITRDPISGAELIVTRLEAPESHIVIEGRFSLGWIGRLTPEQLGFVGLLMHYRGNLQKLASELGIAYNTARNRMDEIVAALHGAPAALERTHRLEVLDRLASGEISFEEATRLLES